MGFLRLSLTKMVMESEDGGRGRIASVGNNNCHGAGPVHACKIFKIFRFNGVIESARRLEAGRASLMF